MMYLRAQTFSIPDSALGLIGSNVNSAPFVRTTMIA